MDVFIDIYMELVEPLNMSLDFRDSRRRRLVIRDDSLEDALELGERLTQRRGTERIGQLIPSLLRCALAPDQLEDGLREAQAIPRVAR